MLKRSREAGTVGLFSALLFICCVLLVACGSGKAAISTTTTMTSATMSPVSGDAATIASSLQSELSQPVWSNRLSLIPRGVMVGTITTAANQTLNSSNAIPVLEQDGYKGSATSTFAISDPHKQIVGDAGVTLYEFSDPSAAGSFFTQWQGSTKAPSLPSVKRSNYSVMIHGECGAQASDCFSGGFVMTTKEFVIEGGFECTLNCKELLMTLGSSLFQAIT